jgi:GT2 family glycosyltransferase
MRVFVSILNFNGKENTFECLRSLEKVSKDELDLKVLVIDNASREKLKLPKLNLDITLVENERNLGFSGGHNVGIKYALENKADYILILNNDTLLDENLVSELVKSFNDQVGVVAPKIYFAKGYEFHKNRYKENEKGKVFWYAGGEMDWANVIGKHRGVDEVDKGQYENAEETDFASGCCMMVKREVFEKVGLFDERYFLYYEDNDLSQRVRSKRFKIIYSPKAFLWHNNAGSVGGSGSDLQDYYISRNRMIFGMKFAPLRSKLSLFRESINLLFWGRNWQKKGILDFYKGKFGKGSYG